MSGLLVLGAGGHGKVVADILQCAGFTVTGFLDDDPERWDTSCLGLPVLGAIDTYADHDPDGLVLGVGSNRARQLIVDRLGAQADPLWINAIHPRAIIADSVHFKRGIAVMAGAIINPDTVISDHVIINTGATVDHDCIIGDYVHIAPGVHLAGGVKIGEGTFIGIGAAVIPYLSIGKWVTVGAGAAVVHAVPDGVTAKGVPARWQEA